uniref:Uncharacterized protein n=1 Tax=viral metagenome TaxID=1070528 RepID=A0A6C0BPV9_9ZZZZ
MDSPKKDWHPITPPWTTPAWMRDQKIDPTPLVFSE